MTQPALEEAVLLITRALVLLDREGESWAAVHLQHAIDVALRKPVPTCEADLAPDFDAEVATFLR